MNTNTKTMAAAKKAAATAGTGKKRAAVESNTTDAGIAPGAAVAEMVLVEAGERGLVVSAKAVHAGLGVGRDFSTWLRSRVSRYGFEIGVDYWTVEGSEDLDSPKRGKTQLDSPERVNQDEQWGGDRKSQDYWLSLDMAKELAMLERSPAGRSARKYFLECERRLKEAQTLLIKKGLQAIGGGDVPKQEYRLSESERQTFRSYMAMFEEQEKLMTSVDFDLDMIILPQLLAGVLEDAGLNDAAIARLELKGYGISFVAAKIVGRGTVTEADVAHRLRTGEMSPRLINAFRSKVSAMMLGRQAAMMEADVARRLKSFGI